jgi:gliding motility-associated-like protein
LVSTGSIITGWEWDFGDQLGVSSGQSPTYVYAASGVYMVSLISETDFGCLDTITHETEVYDLPITDFTFNDVCLYDPVFFQNTSSIALGSITNYYWDFGDGDTSMLQQPVGQEYILPGFYDIKLQTESNNGCFDSLVQTVEIFPIPTALFSYDSVCFPNATSFTDFSTVGGAYNVIDWVWKFGDQIIENAVQYPTHAYAEWGDYFVELTVTSDAGCFADTLLGPVRVHPKPVAKFSDEIANCLGDTTSFFDLSTIENEPEDQLIAWNWDFADGNNSTIQDPGYLYIVPGLYNVELAVTTNNGCQDTVVNMVEIYPLPEVNFTVDTNFGCQPFRAWFTDQTYIPTPYLLSQWEWSFGDGTGTVSSQNPEHTYWDEDLGYFDTGVYTVSLQVTSANGCVSDTSYENYMVEYPKPVALFSVDPERTEILFPKFNITDLSTPNVVDWYYTWGDNGTSTIQHPSHVYQDTGSYNIVQYVTTQFGCMDTAEFTVIVDPDFRFYIPSAFTPDADDINDEFFGSGIGIKEYKMRIYDRWGELIFESNEHDYHWDGTYRGEQVQKGVYVYHFQLLDVKGEPHVYRGGVTLFR